MKKMKSAYNSLIWGVDQKNCQTISDMCAEKFPLMSMGGRAEGLVCADPGARTPISTSGNSMIQIGEGVGNNKLNRHYIYLKYNVMEGCR